MTKKCTINKKKTIQYEDFHIIYHSAKYGQCCRDIKHASARI